MSFCSLGKGSLTLNVGDQKGGSEAILRAAGELKNLNYKIKWPRMPALYGGSEGVRPELAAPGLLRATGPERGAPLLVARGR